ncbi:MAG: hypothetical protein A2W93_03495 [Bacteroidetes bacterium GWF2_43_63]|nr:MAG: hypothetical protein A2W94_09495 [Bacteroidetes bacterium GWE2_42_42]OFY53721.1 MAG: hypothetical protein A2W93_03495 [Bacteroidetes bacterium GWF2_43_63]HBG70929.1 hypothetical protein [Bacteroidales bacterium]HCB62980.1 hypothetical protein [Bacteroidales bacterium]HCY24256.1 hypothetical protein [Bacteroidales bacterium]
MQRYTLTRDSHWRGFAIRDSVFTTPLFLPRIPRIFANNFAFLSRSYAREFESAFTCGEDRFNGYNIFRVIPRLNFLSTDCTECTD